ncbi:hypothetical protein BH23GEM5_BH23GEM5_27770 [soil metagenome]
MNCKSLRSFVRLGTLALIVMACTPTLRTASTAPARDNLEWSAFHWVSATIAGKHFDKAAILVPLTADTLGGTYWLQLDTGADSDVWLYTAPLDQLLRRKGPARDTTRAFVIPSGSIGSYPLRNHAVNIRRVAGDSVRSDEPRPKIGTLGLNFFRNRVLLLDFPAQRFSILDSAGILPTWIEQRASWANVDYRNEKMFLPLTLDGQTYRDFFYDSGASLFPISTSKEIWQAATGRTGTESDNMVWTVRSFGQNVTLVGAPAQGRASVASAMMDRPLVFYMAEGPEQLDMRTWGFPVSGLIGNVLFADRYLVVIDLPRRRFGLVEREEVAKSPEYVVKQ